ncbi:MAG: phosphoribosylanthranilate isomerase [Thiogranum sp.]
MRTRVKICGITRVEDALVAARAGADAIGLVFYRASPRHVDVQQAQTLCRALPPFVSVVGLFVNPSREEVEAITAAVPVDLLQFHGHEPADCCTGFARPYIKAIGMQAGVDPGAVMAEHPHASGFLLDTYQPETHGGGGLAFDWSQVPARRDRPLILAGGLTPENVAGAIEQLGPFGVDVSSGVEQYKGIKSEVKIEAFMRGVERGDASRTRS